jgi:transporter family-2 protein
VSAAAGAGRAGIPDAALPATLVNFLAATVVLAVAAGVETLVHGLPGAPPADPLLFLGGPLGIVFVLSAAALVGRTGVLLFTLATIGGQLLGALVLDLTVPTAGGPPGWHTVAGTVLAVLAVGVAAIPGHRPASDVSG